MHVIEDNIFECAWGNNIVKSQYPFSGSAVAEFHIVHTKEYKHYMYLQLHLTDTFSR